MAGGTGGHIYPALACAQEFRRRGYEILWLGSKASMEESIVPKYDISLRTIAIKGVRGKGVKGLVLAPFRVLQAIFQSLRILRQFKPDVVLGMGGFVTGPGGVAAKLLNVPLVIHEQNAIAGTTNKILAKFASSVLQAFSNVLPQAKTVGNPVRANILEYRSFSDEKPLNDNSPIKLLVVGGSLGAQYINYLVPEFLDEWQRQGKTLEVWHQTGTRNIEEVLTLYKKYNLEARVDAYIENMNDAYEWADLVLCRAGAMTVSELAIVGLPAILVPFPYAIDDHQTENAMHLVNAGAAKIQQQNTLTAETLMSTMCELLEDKQNLITMGLAAKKVAYPEATTTIANECERLIKK